MKAFIIAAALLVLTASNSKAEHFVGYGHPDMRMDQAAPKRHRVARTARIVTPATIHRPSRAERQAQISIATFGIGGSWLESNMGASRPHGAPGLWCGFAMRKEMVSLGFGDPGPEFNLVSHWCRVGSPAPRGAVGSIFVSRGHVSKVVAGECPRGHVMTISGNATGRRVSHMCEPLSRAVCSRWPGSVARR